MTEEVSLEFEGQVGIVSYCRPDKHNAFSDEMDKRLFEILAELKTRPGLRAIVWRGEGKSFSSGRDLAQLGVRTEDLSDLEFIERRHRDAGPGLDRCDGVAGPGAAQVFRRACGEIVFLTVVDGAHAPIVAAAASPQSN